MKSKTKIASRWKTIFIFAAVAIAVLVLFSTIFLIARIYFFSTPFSISGTIKQVDGTFLGGIKVFAQNSDVENAIYSSVSDEKGIYVIKTDKEGSYYIWTDNEQGYVDVFFNNKPFYREPDIVSISDSESNKNEVNFMLSKGFYIKGRIIYGDIGLKNLLVDVYLKDGTWVSGSKTEAGGDFSIGVLPAGVYFLRTWGAGIYGINDIWVTGVEASKEKIPPDDATAIEITESDFELMNVNMIPGEVIGTEEIVSETAEITEDAQQPDEQVSFVKITNPDQDFVVGEKVKVSVEVSPDVTDVIFYINDEVKKVDRDAPFFYRWEVRAGEHIISAIAYNEDDKMIATDSIKVNR